MILLTTRMKSVGQRMMGKLEPVFLNCLGEGDYWEFFKECAFRDEDPECYNSLQDIGRSIVKKLKGSPLAAKTVGGILRDNLSDGHWEKILNSEIWKLEQNDNDIIPALKLSYQHLPSHLKPCFRFCSIFPQDYQFKKEKLVYMWMALGLLHKSKYGTARPEDIGDEYLNDLVGKSFFDCKTDLYRGTYYVMHDLLHELATSVSNGECFRIGDSSEPILIPESVRHLSINTSVRLPIPEIAKLKYLRTLLLREETNPSYCDIPEVLKSLRSLRILESFNFQITDDCFSNLKHLCYLCNKGDYGVPKTVNKLYHLQFLNHASNSHWSSAQTAPDYISNLINLRRLRTPNSVRGIVHDLGRLTSLQILERLDVGKGNNVNKIVELKNLRELRGELSINNLVDVTMVEEAVEANLKAKEHLRKLRLTWTGALRDHGNHMIGLPVVPEVDEQVLDALQPHSNLKNLEIYNYMGRRIPCWMTTQSKIISITLDTCKKLVDLSPVGQLSHLESLELKYMYSVKRVGSEAADRGIGNRVFPSLQKLRIQVLDALEEFYGGASWTTQWLPCLKELSIIGCPNLRVFPNLPCGLRKLSIDDVRWVALPELWVQSGNNESLSSHLSSLDIMSCPCLTSLSEGLLMHSELFTSLKNMFIFDCEELTHLPIGGFSKFTSLKDLSIRGCPKLRRGSTSEEEERLTISRISIENCSDLESLGGLQALPSLKYLTIESVSSQQFPLAELQSLSCLEYLEVHECRNLQSLPDLPSSLDNLCLIDCSPELEERCLKDSGPDWPKIQHISLVVIGHFNKDDLATMTPAEQRRRRQEEEERLTISRISIENCSDLESLGPKFSTSLRL